jgi:hypothetical protein
LDFRTTSSATLIEELLVDFDAAIPGLMSELDGSVTYNP